MTDEPKTGVEQALPPAEKGGKGGTIPPKERRFGQPGGNPRNVRGVPRDAIEMRRLIKQVGAEYLTLPQSEQEKLAGDKPKQIRRIRALVTRMYSSNQPADRAAILKAGWPGILREELDITSDGKPLKGYTVMAHPDQWDKENE